MMYWRSHSRRPWLTWRSYLGLLWCHGCGLRKRGDVGVLSLVDDDRVQWACVSCYARAALAARAARSA